MPAPFFSPFRPGLFETEEGPPSPLDIAIPRLGDVIHLTPAPKIEKSDWTEFFRARKAGEVPKLDRRKVEHMTNTQRIIKAQKETVQADWLVNWTKILTMIDNIEDIGSTAVWLLKKFGPRIGIKAVPGLNLISLALDVADLIATISLFGIAGRKQKGAWRKMTGRQRGRSLLGSQPLTRGPLWRGIKNEYGHLIEAAQATETLFGVGLSIGPIFGAIQEFVMRSAAQVTHFLTAPKPGLLTAGQMVDIAEGRAKVPFAAMNDVGQAVRCLSTAGNVFAEKDFYSPGELSRAAFDGSAAMRRLNEEIDITDRILDEGRLLGVEAGPLDTIAPSMALPVAEEGLALPSQFPSSVWGSGSGLSTQEAFRLSVDSVSSNVALWRSGLGDDLVSQASYYVTSGLFNDALDDVVEVEKPTESEDVLDVVSVYQLAHYSRLPAVEAEPDAVRELVRRQVGLMESRGARWLPFVDVDRLVEESGVPLNPNQHLPPNPNPAFDEFEDRDAFVVVGVPFDPDSVTVPDGPGEGSGENPGSIPLPESGSVPGGGSKGSAEGLMMLMNTLQVGGLPVERFPFFEVWRRSGTGLEDSPKLFDPLGG